MRKLIKEPLLHFLILGLLIFAYSSWKSNSEDDRDLILIDQEEYEYLLSSWKKQWNRDPNSEEIQAFLNQYLQQEVFYKEALEMNLDHNDIIIKRRLAQKMEAVSNDLNDMVNPPTEEELRAFYQENKELFLLEPSYDFKQILFLEDEAQLIQPLLKSLEVNSPIPSSRQTKLSLANAWENAFQNEIDNQFGNGFASSLANLPLNQWSGPITSGFGQHLVIVTQKKPERIAVFEEVKDFIRQEFEYRTELETQEKVYRELLKKYNVRITANSIPKEVLNSLDL